jgi:hypothetical protein
VLILGGDPDLSFRCVDTEGVVSIGVGASNLLGVVAAGVDDDFRSTFTKLDDVTVTLGNKGMILAGLSFGVGAVEAIVVDVTDVFDVEDVVVVENNFSTFCNAVEGRSGSPFPAPTRPKPGCAGRDIEADFPSIILRSNFDLSTVTVSDVDKVFVEGDLWFEPESIDPTIRSPLIGAGGFFLATSTLLSIGSIFTGALSTLSFFVSPDTPSFLSSFENRPVDGDRVASFIPERVGTLVGLDDVVSARLLFVDLRSISFDKI